jgi:catechol 2,3-dioxygenase-like lactoylglutathione lyase family enzyme
MEQPISEGNGAQLRANAPYFFVADINAAVAYYRDVLGFNYERLWGDPPSFCMVYRDGLTIMLKQIGDKSLIRPNGNVAENWDAYVWVRDADVLFDEFSNRKARFAYPVCYQEEYGNREFAVRDLDGYVIAFGHHVPEKK